MKAVKLLIAALFIVVKLSAQSSDNLGFELGNFDNWTGYRGVCCGGAISNTGIVNGWHTLMIQNGLDSNSDNKISFIAPGGGNYSVRLGNPNAGAEAERLRTTFTVTSANANLTYMYAVILQSPPGHSLIEEPKFEVRILDANGNQIPGNCGHYEVIAGQATDGWQKKGDICYKNWTSVAVDLRAYIGSKITLEFTTQDCGQDGHYGYAYIDVVMCSFDIIVKNFCQNADKITLEAPPGFSKYRWLPGGETTSSLEISNPVSGDTFTVELTNEAGCTTVLRHVLRIYPLPVITVCKDTVICAGRGITLDAYAPGAGIKYFWYSNTGFQSTQQNPTVYPYGTTIYNVRAMNPYGCFDNKSTGSVTVMVRNHLVFDLRYTGRACPGDSITLTCPRTAAYYNWYSTPSQVNSNKRTIKFLLQNSTVIHISISDSLCSYEDTVIITVPKDYFDINFCEHDTIIYLASPYPAATYLWSKTGETKSWTTVFNPKNNETIKLYMTNPTGCFKTYNYYLYKHYDPVAIAPRDSIICVGSEMILRGDGADMDGHYEWVSVPPGYNRSGKNVSISPLTSITMYLSASNRYGCKAHFTDSVKIKVKTDAFFTLPANLTICFGESVSLNPHVSKGSFKWSSTPAGYFSYDSIIKVRPLKKMTYSLLHYANGCTYTGNTAIDFFRRPDMKIVDYCVNDTQVILVADPVYSSYDWVLTKDTVPVIAVKPPFTVKYFPMHYTIANGCSDTVYYYLNKIRNPLIHTPPDTIICINSPVEIDLTGVRSGYHYYWTTGRDSFVSDKKKPVFYPKRTSWYKVKVTNEIGCFGAESIDSVKVSPDSTVISELGNDTFVCKGQKVKIVPLKGTGQNSWVSDPSGFYSNDPFINVSPQYSTRYFLQVKNNRCTGNMSDLWVHVWNLPLADAGPDQKMCTDGKIKLSVPFSYQNKYEWTAYKSGYKDSTNIVNVRPERSTIYFVKVTDRNGCVNRDTVTVRVFNYPVIDIGDTEYVCKRTPYYLNAYYPGATYFWSTGDTTPNLRVKESGNYAVTVNNNGCITYDDVEVIYKLLNDTLNIPNIFTPNYDGTNDEYKVTIDNYEFFELTVFNRWGQQIHKSNDPEKAWNGMADNKMASSGVYFYILRIKTNCDDMKSYNGSITLIK
jgi:gliding motility-associated-like protein